MSGQNEVELKIQWCAYKTFRRLGTRVPCALFDSTPFPSTPLRNARLCDNRLSCTVRRKSVATAIQFSVAFADA